MKKHVFLMQVHKQPELVSRIVRRLESDNHYFIINIDSKCKHPEQFHDLLAGIKNVIFNERVNVMHGGFSQIQCTLIQIRMALSGGVKFDYFHTISGQCYPCVSVAEFDNFFENNNKSYMMLDSNDQVKEWRKKKYSDRLEHFHFRDIFNRPWEIRFHLSGIFTRLMWYWPRKYPNMDEIWGGVELVFFRA